LAGVRNSAIASQHCPSGHITADKREIKDFPKLPSATSFIRQTLYEIVGEDNINKDVKDTCNISWKQTIAFNQFGNRKGGIYGK